MAELTHYACWVSPETAARLRQPRAADRRLSIGAAREVGKALVPAGRRSGSDGWVIS
jgi:hypothetical protein